ncbi:helix-turn-helix transcriptional regulator, partial [Streptomyces sp. NPDC052644]
MWRYRSDFDPPTSAILSRSRDVRRMGRMSRRHASGVRVYGPWWQPVGFGWQGSRVTGGALMPRRSIPDDPSIGDRIRARRELRGWSVRYAASRAGISHTSWSRIERGLQRTDRYMVVDLAAALECSVVDLTGQAYTPADRQLDAARIDAERVWRVMMDTPMARRSEVTATVEQVRREAALVRGLYGRCDYAGALRRLVDLVPAMHGLTDRRAALSEMVPVYGVAMGSLLNVSYPAHAWLAAERCAEAAGLLDDRVAVGVAAANRARVSAYSGAYGPARAW